MTKEKKRAYDKACYEERKTQGICTYCGSQPATKGYTHCDRCREKESIKRKQRNEMRKSAGMCTKCGKNAAREGKTTCYECAESNSQYHSELYHWYKANGICVQCGQEKAARGKTLCLVCKSDRDEKNRRRGKKTDEQKRKNNERGKELREERKARGECPKCGKKMPGQWAWGKYACPECTSKNNRSAKERRIKSGTIPNELRGNGEYCAVCRNSVEHPGEKLCNKCYTNCCEALTKAREHRIDNYFTLLIKAQWKEGTARKEKLRSGV